MKKCILILDDDPEILLICRIILEKLDYQVETRTRCDNIIKDIREEKPVLVLMDIWIPNMGGEKATKMIKKNKDTKHIPVILFSANSEIEEIFKRSNANGFLKKPFEIGALVTMVETNILQVT
jgi:DNA-binding NtrC family response regulator